MKPKYFSALCDSIAQWRKKLNDEDSWPCIYTSPDIDERMASAAAAILDVVEASQKYALQEELLQEKLLKP